MKRGATGLCGLLAIDKPQGITSHDVVDGVRRLTGERRVGHAGTLDPMATGVMLVAVGAATRLSPYLTGHDKSYRARIVFGAATDTDDAEGRVVTAYSKSSPGTGLERLDREDPQRVLDSIVGDTLQLPPVYSAIKKNGVTAYKAAREGKEMELEPRAVTIYSAQFVDAGRCPIDLDDGNGGRFVAELPYWDVDLSVSKGTYIRSIARDLGQSLGCGAHLGALRRTRVGQTRVEECSRLAELARFSDEPADLPWADPAALLGFCSIELSDEEAAFVANGRTISVNNATGVADGGFVSCIHGGKLVSIHKRDGDVLRPATVIPGGVCGVAERVAAAAKPAKILSWDPGSKEELHLGERVIAFGVFDGLHKGHQTIFDAAKADARSRDAKLAILTFEKDPDEVFGRDTAKLMENGQRLSALADPQLGAAEVIAIKTDMQTLGIAPVAFLELLRLACTPVSVHVGQGFRFGARAEGTVKDMKAWASGHGSSCSAHELACAAGAPISATRIRELLADGDVRQAAELLGRHHCVCGMVVKGRGEGTGMGFATANVEFAPGAATLPREGVYGGYVCVDGKRYAAAINVGVAKSFENATAQVEAHLLDFEGDLYGKEIELQFVEWLREQRVFDDMDELISVVTDNIQWVRDNLRTEV